MTRERLETNDGCPRKWFECHVPKNVETFTTKMED